MRSCKQMQSTCMYVIVYWLKVELLFRVVGTLEDEHKRRSTAWLLNTDELQNFCSELHSNPNYVGLVYIPLGYITIINGVSLER